MSEGRGIRIECLLMVDVFGFLFCVVVFNYNVEGWRLVN